MKKLGISLVVVAAILAVCIPASAQALSGSEFRAGSIMDDSLFFGANNMSSDEVQTFLNAKVPVCDTNGTQPYAGTTRAAYSTSRGYPPPFICLKDYRQDIPSKAAQAGLCGTISAGNKSAAQIITEVANACSVNARVLLVLLQKEQSLVTDDWPWPTQYRSATGYACPDTAPCDAEFYGFFNQVYSAAKQFKRYAAYPSSYNYRAFRNNYVQYNPNASCGGSSIYIENQATAGLYNYTPYQPNQPALNNLYGTGDSCSAYGNRNFWRMYNEWFGKTTGPEYAWSIESFTYAGGDNIIGTGETETVTLRVKNIGRQPWYNHGNHPIRLGTWEPTNRASALAANNWLSSSRPVTLTENSVQPGELGTFTFNITSSKVGTFAESFNLVAENYQWFQWPGFRPTITVNSGYSWSVQNIIYERGTGVMEPGRPQLITLVAKNTGNITWSKTSGPAIRLGTWQPDRKSSVGSGWISQTRAVSMNESTVAPGQNAGFQFYVQAPTGGTFYERMNLVAEGTTWFNDPGLTLYLQGLSYQWEPVFHSHSTGTANIPRNTEFNLTVKVKNTGSMTWRKNSSYPVRLATVAPQNRGSALYSPSWITDTRPAALIEDTVAPGEFGTFTFNAKSPSTPGPRTERFSLIAEGVLWFNDPGFSIYVNSL